MSICVFEGMSTPSEMSQGGQLDLSMKGPHHNNTTSSHLDMEDESDDEKSEGEIPVKIISKRYLAFHS